MDRPTIMRHTVADSYSATTAALLHHSPRLDPLWQRRTRDHHELGLVLRLKLQPLGNDL